MKIKNLIKSGLVFLRLDLSKNMAYDRQTKLIIKQVINQNSNCIDVGCHKGEILDLILKQSPNGKHFAFEPLPHLYESLSRKYVSKTTIHPFALSNKTGFSSFQFIKNAPAYSGLRKRDYDIKNPDIEEITVEIKRLDEIIPPDTKIDFIKIDVEGGEYDVMKGAKKLLKRDQPHVIFECGLGANNYYEASPNELYNFLTIEIGFRIYLLKSFLNNQKQLTLDDFEYYYRTNKEYYFIAHPAV